MTALVPSIEVDGVGKRFTKYEDTPMLLSSVLRLRNRSRRSQLWALRHASFEIPPGACVGVVGRNGSGKSTLLQMLAGVTAPTEGRVRVRGRIAPLISVGVGFHPELTGRENVYVNATILGLGREEIDARFDEIVAFAEIGDFIDTPVKFYSSGMFVRLGFSVSVLAEPDVLLVDEVLAVGDLAFQVKCFERIEQLRASGTTIVMVTHNLNAVRRLCDRSIVIHDGELRHDGDTNDALSTYHDLLAEPRPGVAPTDLQPKGASAELRARLDRVEMTDVAGVPSRHFGADDKLTLTTTVRFRQPVRTPLLGVVVANEAGIHVYGDHWVLEDESGPIDAGTELSISVTIGLHLASGSYSAQLGLVALDGEVLASPPPQTLFYVAGRDRVNGVSDLGGHLRVDPQLPPEA